MCFVCSDLSKGKQPDNKTDLSKGTANNRFYLVVFWLFWLLSSNS